MTTIRTTCPRCGEVDMGPQAILLSVTQGGREGTYRFTCPTCYEAVEKRADRKIVALLVSAGGGGGGRGADGDHVRRGAGGDGRSQGPAARRSSFQRRRPDRLPLQAGGRPIHRGVPGQPALSRGLRYDRPRERTR